MNIGFTGTRQGMTSSQLTSVMTFLDKMKPRKEALEESRSDPTFLKNFYSAHHGCCVGSDIQFATLAKRYKFWVVGHPSSDTPIYQIPVEQCSSDELTSPKPALIRNHDIVNGRELVFATPKTLKEEIRSGTWAAIRFALKSNIPVKVVWPDGSHTNSWEESVFTKVK